jgi:small-conductance mechanosensitive channel
MPSLDGASVFRFARLAPAACLIALFAASPAALSQPATPLTIEDEVPRAPVEVDGNVLFEVRGVSTFSAEDRAAAIAERIRALARDSAFQPDSLRRVPDDIGVRIVGGAVTVMTVADADARLENVTPQELAAFQVRSIQQAIEEFRRARTPKRLVPAALEAIGVLAGAALAVALLLFLMRRLRGLLERRLQRRLEAIRIQSFELVRLERLHRALRAAPRAVTALGIAVIAILALQIVLGLFPWTRHIARRLAGWIVAPLETMAAGVAAKIPDLIFLAVLFLVIRFVLRVLRLFFDAIGRKDVVFAEFDPEWAEPTFKLVRLAVIAFAVVVAYPYIPGSNTAAFKGVSLFLGIVFSLGSSSAISNIIAGYTMTYRRAFRIGDRVRIGGVTGDVSRIRLQVTHLTTPKNEEVIVPNSTILNSEVVNYSSFARSKGLILHTKVGIGYETPWRQVEAMLRLAAERTPGLLREPSPFILLTDLGDFAVVYELNVHCEEPRDMFPIRSALHRNILDVFNEYGVQIMTPAYEGDPERPKVVPKEHWHAAPADGGR